MEAGTCPPQRVLPSTYPLCTSPSILVCHHKKHAHMSTYFKATGLFLWREISMGPSVKSPSDKGWYSQRQYASPWQQFCCKRSEATGSSLPSSVPNLQCILTPVPGQHSLAKSNHITYLFCWRGVSLFTFSMVSLWQFSLCRPSWSGTCYVVQGGWSHECFTSAS